MHVLSVCVSNVCACVDVCVYVGYAKYEFFAQKGPRFLHWVLTSKLVTIILEWFYSSKCLHECGDADVL